MKRGRQYKELVKPGLRALLSVICLILFLMIISNVRLFSIDWPFELFSSYVRQTVIASLIICALASFLIPRLSVVIAIIASLAAVPWIGYSDYISASHGDCRSGCLTVGSINLRGSSAALHAMANASDEEQPDLLALLHLPGSTTPEELARLFPDYSHVERIDRSISGDFDRPIVILSKLQTTKVTGILPDTRSKRGIATIDLELSRNTEIIPIRLIAIHSYFPLSRKGMMDRNAYFAVVADISEEVTSYIVLGDANVVPWAPAFQVLPGQRAGDPRWNYSWDANRPWLGIPIDHILLSPDIELIETSTGPPIGSDHLPTFARIRLSQ